MQAHHCLMNFIRNVKFPHRAWVWGSIGITAALLLLLGSIFGETFAQFDFVNRGQTWLPLFALMVGALFGAIDDVLEITKSSGGLRLRWRLAVVAAVSGFIGWWFFAKLGVAAVGIPFVGTIALGWFFIPFFILVALALYAGGVIDGIDGLAGGVFAFIFMTYAGIAFAQNQIALAAFAATVAGALFAFLWFNIPPARFYLSETGTMALTMALPIIALPLTVTVITSIMQTVSKKVFRKKLFRIAPIHHHFEAIGWPAYKVTMRYWVITIIAGILGLALALLK
jgi:phospho-N-acetylmuramoyl-pentapeptide-transferase